MRLRSSYRRSFRSLQRTAEARLSLGGNAGIRTLALQDTQRARMEIGLRAERKPGVGKDAVGEVRLDLAIVRRGGAQLPGELREPVRDGRSAALGSLHQPL